MAGTINERFRFARSGTREFHEALRQHAHSEAQVAHAKGYVEERRAWLHKARRQTELLRLMAKNETWEREHGNIAD
jgi:hypothetical protein